MFSNPSSRSELMASIKPENGARSRFERERERKCRFRSRSPENGNEFGEKIEFGEQVLNGGSRCMFALSRSFESLSASSFPFRRPTFSQRLSESENGHFQHPLFEIIRKQQALCLKEHFLSALRSPKNKWEP